MTIGDSLELDPLPPRTDSMVPNVVRAGSHATPWIHRVAVALCASLVFLLVSHPINDYDVWQHLRVGEVMWRFHELPRENLWTWPTFGAPYDVPSWLFRLLLWPFCQALAVEGLALWRWVTALSLAALLYAGARRASA